MNNNTNCDCLKDSALVVVEDNAVNINNIIK